MGGIWGGDRTAGVMIVITGILYFGHWSSGFIIGGGGGGGAYYLTTNNVFTKQINFLVFYRLIITIQYCIWIQLL